MTVSYISARELDITNPAHIYQIILEIDNEENRRRRRKSWIAHQCLEGNQKEYVQERLDTLYPDTSKKFRVGDISIVKKVNDKQSKAYKNPPIRIIEGNDNKTKQLSGDYKKYKFHRTFKEFDSLFNLNKYSCIWLTWQNAEERKAEEGIYIAHALAPYEFDLVKDQVSGEPIVFIMNYPDINITRQAGHSDAQEQTIAESQSDTSSKSRIYRFWDNNNYVKAEIIKQDGTGNNERPEIEVKIIEQKSNPIGRLPIVYSQQGNSIDYPIDNNLAEQSIEWNVSFSDLKTASATQGHGQLIVSYPEGQKMNALHMGMHTAISLPQSKKPDSKPTTAEYISASPDLGGQLEVLKFDLMNILDEHGVKSKGSVQGGSEQFSSGFDRLLSEADTMDIVESNQATYSDEVEPEFFELYKAYEQAMNSNTFSSEDKIEIYFEKPKVLISDKETLENIKMRDELGLMLPWEKHIIMNPNLTEEQAKEREEEIQALLKERRQEMLESMTKEEDDSDDDSDDDSEEEENENVIGE